VEAQMLTAGIILACISGITLILAVVFQTTTAESFSASLGGQETSRFQKGSRDEMLDKVAKVAAVSWILISLFVAILWFRAH
jgi:protein translocase SecG subunit